MTTGHQGVNKAKSLSHLDLADSNPRKKNLTSASAFESLKFKLKNAIHQGKQLDKQQPRNSAAIENLQVAEFSKTEVSDNSSASSSGSVTGSDSTGCRGFDEPTPSDLSNYEAAYISATSNPESQSPESSQEGNNYLNITTPTTAPAPAHPTPKHKKKSWLKELDINSAILAKRMVATGPKEPSVRIVQDVNKRCDVCDNSRYFDLDPATRQSLHCSCQLKVTNCATPPVSPTPSPGPVTRNRGQRQGKYKSDGALVKFKK